MLDHAAKLTRKPWAVTRRDVRRLRDRGGFTDRAILDINLVCGYYAFVNRLADGLGVPLEEFWKRETKNEKRKGEHRRP